MSWGAEGSVDQMGCAVETGRRKCEKNNNNFKGLQYM